MKKVLLFHGIALIKKENQIILMLTRAVVTAKQILETKMINTLRLDFAFTSMSTSFFFLLKHFTLSSG